MKIIEYCKKHHITQTELATRAGVTNSYITHIIKERRIPSVQVALLIEKATNGEVSAIELLKLNDSPYHNDM